MWRRSVRGVADQGNVAVVVCSSVWVLEERPDVGLLDEGEDAADGGTPGGEIGIHLLLICGDDPVGGVPGVRRGESDN